MCKASVVQFEVCMNSTNLEGLGVILLLVGKATTVVLKGILHIL